jgi:integrase/recombinase XerD
MASFFKRNNGFFYAVESKRGKRRWLSLHTRNRQEARSIYAEIATEIKRRQLNMLSFFMEEFLKAAPMNYSVHTIALYQAIFKTYLRIQGDRSIRRILPSDIEAFKQKRIKEVSPVSLNIELRMLKAAFSWGIRMEMLESSPFRGVKMARVPYKEGQYMSVVEFLRLMNVIDDSEYRNLIKFAALTILRRGEIINLRWVDADLVRKEIHIRAHGTFEPKSRKPRVVPMHDWVHAFLASKRRVGEYVFLDKFGHQFKAGTVTHRFKRYAKKAGLNGDVHFHNLRHTGISWLINEGVPLPFVQRLAGHSSPIVTQAYTHLDNSNLVKAVNAFPLLN